MTGAATRRVGLISDTHGLLRPEAVAFLRGSDRIVHGGDIGSEGILHELAALAPVTAVVAVAMVAIVAIFVLPGAIARLAEISTLIGQG